MPSAASRPRIHCAVPLEAGRRFELPEVAARHVQVLRLQPGSAITLFNGEGGQWEAQVERMGRSEVAVRVLAHEAVEREAARPIHLAVGMPANDRMDWLVEKATELGAASIQPLAVERSVLKLAGERAERKRQHWQAIAIAACEQCGRNRVPDVRAPMRLENWLAQRAAGPGDYLLAPDDSAAPLGSMGATGAITLLSGPEGGLSAAEQAAARECGFVPASLGPRVLRAETAPLAALALLTLGA